MFCTYTRPRYQMSVYSIIGPLVICFDFIDNAAYIFQVFLSGLTALMFQPSTTMTYTTALILNCLSTLSSNGIKMCSRRLSQTQVSSLL